MGLAPYSSLVTSFDQPGKKEYMNKGRKKVWKTLLRSFLAKYQRQNVHKIGRIFMQTGLAI